VFEVENEASTLNEYLFGKLEATYPVLSAIAATLNLIAEAKGEYANADRRPLPTDGTGH